MGAGRVAVLLVFLGQQAGTVHLERNQNVHIHV